jgi:uracil-DNA glycosylase
VTTKRNEYLNAMGIDVWKLRDSPSAKDEDTRGDVKHDIPADDDWEQLQRVATSCTLCELSKSRTNVVFGVGNRNADIMLVGEAPGENEDLQGEPFVGRAGMLLNQMLLAIGLERNDVYITNVLKCRPPRNRDPSPQEVVLCTPYLKQQIALIKPKVIIAVGRIAAHYLLNTDESMGRLRGKIYNYGELKTPLFVIYHPAYLLRSPSEKAKAYSDLLKIQNFIKNL